MASKLNQERYYTSAGDIYSVLRTLHSDRSSINIEFENSNTLSASLVLAANLRDRTFHLDQFSTSEAHKRAAAGTSFAMRASINGIRVLAKDMRIARISEDRDGMYYEVAFPERLLYLQRRDAFRAWVPGTLMVNVECKSSNHPDGFMGRMQNMSATGFRMVVDGTVLPAPEMMQNFQITTHLPLLDQDLSCNSTAIYVQYLKERNHTVFGFRFEDLGIQEQLSINRFVTQLQREAIT
jgi:flagellar brake protein